MSQGREFFSSVQKKYLRHFYTTNLANYKHVLARKSVKNCNIMQTILGLGFWLGLGSYLLRIYYH